MGLGTRDDSSHFDDQESNAPEEKILVTVRLRPLNEREITNNDVSVWECINSNTILFKNNLAERSMLPVAYSFDGVFGCDSTTRQVYEDAAKRVALSVMSGINSSIFAYGQTSSGKTYTMCGITEYSVADIYDYIDMHASREFVLKFSAMEIYNEAVKDLLSTDGTPLRLLDDPERGTIVEKLTEVTLRDWSHLKELLSVCEAHRKVGETSLNEMSSRSHQILRLTVESSAREYKRSENSSTLAATVHFVDLAGSERASQALSAGARLKEGCHINRSLLTLGTVIRKLSKGRNGHVPYRDSKLTRILQNSLGGNARTAVVCTMSPAHSHVEQSRNTLLFASCAKQVSTNAQVNVVMSEKALVKQLQKELARLEGQLKNLGTLSTSCDSLALKEKELLIEKMDKEIRELTQQRDQAHSRLQSLLSSTADDQVSRPSDEPSNISESQEKVAWLDEYSASEESVMIDPLGFASSESHFPDPSEEQFLSDDISPRMFIEKYFGPDPTQGWEKIAQRTDENSEDNCKEVRCIETNESMRNINSDAVSSLGNGDQVTGDVGIHSQKIFDYLVESHPAEQSPCSSETDVSDPKSIHVSRSTSNKAIITTMPLSPMSQTPKEDERTPSNGFEKDSPISEEGKDEKFSELEPAACGEKLRRENSEESFASDSTDDKPYNTKSSSLDEVIKPKANKQSGDNLILGAEQTPKTLVKTSDNGLDGARESQEAPSDWSMEFERQRREIIELWDDCKIPLVHRSFFFLVFKGDPSDSIYMEVELRRLSYLKISQGTNNVKMGQIFKQASSIRALNRERQMLSKIMLKKLSSKEREALFEKWGIGLKTKQRRLQLSRLLWTDTKDMDHIKESAALIAKLVGFTEPSQAPKEMVGLSFSTPQVKVGSFNWKQSMPNLV